MKTVLTIAGSDCSGGAGIQADIKTICAHGLYAMSAITALTAQNTTGVYGVYESSPEFVAQQLDCIFTDIRPDAVKIGMVSSAEIITAIADRLRFYNADNVVIDPVMVSTSGSSLMNNDAQSALIGELFPLGTLITPNIPEAEEHSGMEIKSEADMIAAAEKINCKCAVLIKGGHLSGDAADLLYSGGKVSWFRANRVNNCNTHGTGCTLSSAIACGLADGATLEESVEKAKMYVLGALEYGLDLGKGKGPLNHMYAVK